MNKLQREVGRETERKVTRKQEAVPVTKQDRHHANLHDRGPGFIGPALIPQLIQAGHQVLGLTRSEAGAETLRALGPR